MDLIGISAESARLLALGFCLATSAGAAEMEKMNVAIAEGPCEPTWKSLGDHFKQPKWWREAKIGMWLHWGPQSVGEDGDWYGLKITGTNLKAVKPRVSAH